MTDLRTGGGIAATAFLMGDPARAAMLAALLGGQALTAGELAAEAGITAQTASSHLVRLVEGGLVAVERQGRHRYVRLASPAVAEALEGLMALASPAVTTTATRRPRGPRDAAMRLARTCYDHMAGRLGVALADALERDGRLRLDSGAGLVTPAGEAVFPAFGIDLAGPATARRPLCRTCLDWSERRPHLAGRLGAALLARSLELGWVARAPKSRTLAITPAGERGFVDVFRCEPVWHAPDAAEARRAVERQH
ncbi:ArsR/SmtB family transcription factor [Antarcticirhabdus aurantiaca]|uniref:Helix-turn-helix domain-containing protein n=1 Tax=Antarcticirhabdus aurantiaca TaxID=2606717 RepID=A0ACD4NWW8_9HYPH|nr:helix-turn-helix domain-containing protein [Antarcticirhabdus aurantiaca]WAJ31600.1 helix-turn-helix domain-containing protein [Jeongeuplla avenae]